MGHIRKLQSWKTNGNRNQCIVAMSNILMSLTSTWLALIGCHISGDKEFNTVDSPSFQVGPQTCWIFGVRGCCVLEHCDIGVIFEVNSSSSDQV